MARRKETELKKTMELAREIMKAREEGKSIGLAELLEEVINAFMDDGKPYSSF